MPSAFQVMAEVLRACGEVGEEFVLRMEPILSEGLKRLEVAHHHDRALYYQREWGAGLRLVQRATGQERAEEEG